MRHGALRGCLKRLLPSFRDGLFRVIVLATLLNIVVVFSYNRPYEIEPEGKSKSPESIWKLITSDPTALVTLWLFGATCILAVVTTGLWWSTGSLVEGAEETAERQLRAYLHLESVKFVTPNDAKGRHYIHAIIKNFGQTPCYKSVLTVECDVCERKPENTIIPLTDKAEVQPNFIFPPGHIHTVTIDRTVEVSGPGRWNALNQEGKSAYVWGRIDYKDAFDKPRFVTFQLHCDFYSATNFAFSKVGNDAN